MTFKRCFTNIFRVEYQEVNLESLARVFGDGDTVTPQTLAEKGLIKKADEPVVILGVGDLSAKLAVSAHRFSNSERKIEAAGGRCRP